MSADSKPDDPVFLHARREAIVILVLWAACFAWTVPYCYLNGYDTPADPAELEILWGMPAWVVWGVALPWAVAGVISILLCVFFIEEDDLGQAPDEVGPAESAAEINGGSSAIRSDANPTDHGPRTTDR